MGDLMSGIAGLAAVVAALALFIYWLSCLVKWDGEPKCDESQCGTCPFPCEIRDARMMKREGPCSEEPSHRMKR